MILPDRELVYSRASVARDRDRKASDPGWCDIVDLPDGHKVNMLLSRWGESHQSLRQGDYWENLEAAKIHSLMMEV